jgi:hypothetical protein
LESPYLTGGDLNLLAVVILVQLVAFVTNHASLEGGVGVSGKGKAIWGGLISRQATIIQNQLIILIILQNIILMRIKAFGAGIHPV